MNTKNSRSRRCMPDPDVCRTQALPRIHDLALCLLESPSDCPFAFRFVGQHYCDCLKADKFLRERLGPGDTALPLRDFFGAVRLRDLKDGFVTPKHDVSERIA